MRVTVVSKINGICQNESSPEKAGVGGSTPSRGTIPAIDSSLSKLSFNRFNFQAEHFPLTDEVPRLAAELESMGP